MKNTNENKTHNFQSLISNSVSFLGSESQIKSEIDITASLLQQQKEYLNKIESFK